MNINGKINLFVNTHKRADGSVFNSFSTSVSGKDGESRINLSLEAKFDKENFPAEKLDRLSDAYYYVLEVEEGFLGVRQYADKAGVVRKVPVVWITKAAIKEKKPVKAKVSEDELPF